MTGRAYLCSIYKTAYPMPISQLAPLPQGTPPYWKYPSSSTQNLSPVFSHPSKNVSFVAWSLFQYPRAMLGPLSHKFPTWFGPLSVPWGLSSSKVMRASTPGASVPIVRRLLAGISLTGLNIDVIVCEWGGRGENGDAEWFCEDSGFSKMRPLTDSDIP